MWPDEIVEQVRQARQVHAKKFDYELNAIYEDLKQQEQESHRQKVSLPPKKLELGGGELDFVA